MATQLFDTLLILGLGTILGIFLTYSVGGWFENRKKRKKVLTSLKLYLSSQHKLLYEHQRNNITINTKILDKFFVEGNLTLCGEEFKSYFKHYYNWIKSANKKYIEDEVPWEEIPEEYYKTLMHVNIALVDTIEQELKPFYIKWKKRFKEWRKRRKESSF